MSMALSLIRFVLQLLLHIEDTPNHDFHSPSVERAYSVTLFLMTA